MKKLLTLPLLCALITGILVFRPGSLALTQAQDGFSLTAEAGFSGYYKEGKWFPVRVTLENKGVDFEGEVQVRFTDTGANTNIFSAPVLLPSISRKEIFIYIFPQGYGRELEVSLVSGKRILLRRQIQVDQVPQDQILYGILSEAGSTFNLLAQVSPMNRTSFVAQITLDDIPERTQPLSALDILIFSNIDTGSLTQAQRQAIWSWVAGGGRLLVTGGANWQKTIQGLNDLNRLPISFITTQEVNTLEGIQDFSGSIHPIESSADGILIATGELSQDAQVLAYGSTPSGKPLPVVVRQVFGAGEIIQLGFDPALAPFKNWEGRVDFYQALFSTPSYRPSWLLGMRNWIQAKEAAQTLLQLGLPSPVWICGFLFLYILLIGPLNYLVLRKLKRQVLGWATIPLIVVSLSMCVIVTGMFSRGREPVLNRAAIIQAWEGHSEARVDGVVGIYSPTRTSYQAESASPFLLHPLPDTSGVTIRNYLTLQSSEEWKIPDIQIDISGIVPLAFEGYVPAPQVSHDLALKASSQGVTLQGKLTLQSQLTLEDAVLLAPGGVQALGTLNANQPKSINLALTRSQYAGETLLNPSFTVPFSAGFPSPMPSSTQADTTLEDIIGTSNYYDKRENYRRYALLSAAMNYYYSSGSARGVGFYLAGWVDQFPDVIRLSDRPYSTEDTVVYLIAIQPSVILDSEEVTLTPGLFAWRILEGTDYNISPYDLWLYSGMSYALEFTPIMPANFTKVKSLTLNLEQPSTSGAVSGVKVSLWDFEEGGWTELKSLTWGVNPIEDPQTWIGRDGRIRLKIEADYASGFQISRSDFTLVAEK